MKKGPRGVLLVDCLLSYGREQKGGGGGGERAAFFFFFCPDDTEVLESHSKSSSEWATSHLCQCTRRTCVYTFISHAP